MSAFFDYEVTVRAVFGFASQHPAAFVWIAGIAILLALSAIADTVQYLIQRSRGAR